MFINSEEVFLYNFCIPPKKKDFRGGAYGERQVQLEEGEEKFSDKDDKVLKLRGLPYRVAKADIIRFFEPSFSITASQIQIVCAIDGRPAGEAMVQMSSKIFLGGF